MRTPLIVAFVGALVTLGSAASAGGASETTVWISADVGDDDSDGRMDAGQALSGPLWSDAPVVARSRAQRTLSVLNHGAFRLWLNRREVTATLPLQAKGELRVQGVGAGQGSILWGDQRIAINVVRGWVLDDAGTPIDLVASQGSMARVPPTQLGERSGSPRGDGLRWVVASPTGTADPRIELVSQSAEGVELDRLARIRTAPTACPSAVPEGFACHATGSIYLVGLPVDQAHRVARGRGVRAEVGGRVVASFRGVAIGALRVGAPRSGGLGKPGRWRLAVRVLLVRDTPKGALPLGEDLEAARRLLLPELRATNEIWGQCGISVGNPEQVPILAVDPPPPESLTFGCGLGLPASGGGTVAVNVGKRGVRMPTHGGSSPISAAIAFAQELQRMGFSAEVFRIPTQNIGALPLTDVRVRSRGGGLLPLSEIPSTPLSTDRTLGVCLGRVDLSDGLSHFTDHSAGQGTLEERSLLRALEDDDPATVDILVVSEFSEGQRLGESFIRADGSTPSNKVVLDAAGVASGPRSHVLAHELGHILMDAGGHPDDFGTDSPWSLMDSDATGSGIFGPLRLSVEECERAFSQSAGDGSSELLKAWPLPGRATPP